MICIRVVLISCFLLLTGNAWAGIPLISDEETESFLIKITRPIFGAAGISFSRDYVYVVNDDNLNAFVGDENRLFINTGTIIKADSIDELRGVIAHEAGHILGGHILRMKIKSEEMSRISLASLLAAGALIAASGRADVGMAVLLGSQSSLMTHYASYRVQEERSADEAAVKILNRIEKSPAGMRDFMKKIQQQNELSGIEETPYFRTHPVTMERVTFMDEAVKKSKYLPSVDGGEFLRIKAKLVGFLYHPNKVLAMYPTSNKSTPAKYARSIANFRRMKLKEAMIELDELIAREPYNPFFYELKGQMFFETGNMSGARVNYKKALDLLPDSEIFKQNLVHATLEDETSNADLRQAVDILTKSLIKSDNAYSWLMLSKAYGKLNDMAYSNYAAAEYSLRIGEEDIALKQAKTALNYNPSQVLELKIEDLIDRLEEIISQRGPMYRRRR